MRRAVWRIATANLPQAVRGTKRRLLRWPRRGLTTARLFKRHRVTWAATQEVGLRTAAAFNKARRRFPRLSFLLGARNAPASWYVANGSVTDTDVLDGLHRRTLRIQIPRSLGGGLRNIVIQLLRDRGTDERGVFIAGHADRKRPDPGPNLYVLEEIARTAADIHARLCVPVVVALDTNNRPAAIRIFREYGLELLAGEGIDLVFGIGVEPVGRPMVLDGFQGVVTDHHNPPAVDVTPTLSNTSLTRIPRWVLHLNKSKEPR